MEENLYLIHSFSHNPFYLCIMILRYFSTGEEKLSSLEKFICLRFRVALIQKTLAKCLWYIRVL